MVSKKALPTDHIPILGRIIRFINRKGLGEVSSPEGVSDEASRREFDPSEQREKRDKDFQGYFAG